MHPPFEATLAAIMAKQATGRHGLPDGPEGTVSGDEHVTEDKRDHSHDAKGDRFLVIYVICE